MIQTIQSSWDLYDHLNKSADTKWQEYMTASGEAMELLTGDTFDADTQKRYHLCNSRACEAYGASQAYRQAIKFILEQTP